MQTSWPIAVILTLKAEGSSDCLHHRHPEPFKGEGSSEVLLLVECDWILRCAQHDGNQDCMLGPKTQMRRPRVAKEDGVGKKHKCVRRAKRDRLRAHFRAEAFGVMARRAYNTKGLPVEYNRKSEGWDWVFL